MNSTNLTLLGVVIPGHQVASGNSANTPFPAGTIALQKPHFKRLGLNLDDCFDGTINVSISPYHYKVAQADWSTKQLNWLDGYHPEDFSFVKVGIRHQTRDYQGWLYLPHPETKTRDFHPTSTMEILAPPIDNLNYGDTIELIFAAGRIALTAGEQ